MSAPRVPPLPPEEWDGEIADLAGVTPPGSDTPLGSHNIFGTLARNPELFKSWLPFGGRLLVGGRLPARDRELMILRTAVRCRCSYEWGQHVRISLAVGIEREELDRVVAGPDADGWTAHEGTLLRAVDELHDQATITDATWNALAESYDEPELIEVPILIGHYHLVAFALNALGVELDDDLEPLPG